MAYLPFNRIISIKFFKRHVARKIQHCLELISFKNRVNPQVFSYVFLLWLSPGKSDVARSYIRFNFPESCKESNICIIVLIGHMQIKISKKHFDWLSPCTYKSRPFSFARLSWQSLGQSRWVTLFLTLLENFAVTCQGKGKQGIYPTDIQPH